MSTGRRRPLLGIICADRAHGRIGMQIVARATSTELGAQRIVGVGRGGCLLGRSGDARGEGIEAAASCLHGCVAEGTHGEGMRMEMEMEMAQQLSSSGQRWIALAPLPISCSLTPSHTLTLSLSQQQRAHREQASRIWREEMLRLDRVERRLKRSRGGKD